ncbi:MAG: biopolymer transport protein ExbD [Sphingomonadales bacterium]|nr:biopolymer transport protein ExbD [Sphingomonadales bacterium]
MSASVTNPESSEPMMDINTTPLIDVMLVLLIMFIITIPVQTHAVKLDLPQASNERPLVDPQKNVVVILPDDTVLWNGGPVTMTILRQYLDASKNMPTPPELHLQPHAEARYEVVDEVLAQTKLAEITTMGFVGNEYYADVFQRP